MYQVKGITESRTFQNTKEKYVGKRTFNFTIKGTQIAIANTMLGILSLMIIFAGIFVIQFFQNKAVWKYLTLMESYSQKIQNLNLIQAYTY